MKYKYIDLFCGGGGIGEGFNQAGFKSAYHVDMNQWAIQTVMLREIYHLHENKSKFFEILKENSEVLFSAEVLFNENDFPDYKKVTNKVLIGEINDNHNNIVKQIKKNIKDSEHSVIIGGPPCQAYSFAKRSRMRAPTDNLEGLELEEAEKLNDDRVEQYLKDKKHTLFEGYLKIINEISPSAFVYENVPGILTAEKSMDKKDQKGKIIDFFRNEIGSKEN
jgi:Site-specific DNA methylase